MSRHLRHRWWLALVIAGTSCSIPKTHFYTLEVPHVPALTGGAVARHITVQRFRADQVLMDDRILYRVGSHEVNFYEYHRWASPPVDLVTDYFLHRLQDSGDYARVSSYKDGARSDFTLNGRLFRFEEVDRDKEVSVSVALELELQDSKTRASIWRGETECTHPVGDRTVAGVVRGIYACLEEAAGKLLPSMQEEVGKIR
jgi:ABC-type uncharacterized transport system auxiliary subunit